MSPGERRPIRRALVSVFDKRGLDRLAGALGAAGVEVVSTGSTAAALEGHGLRVTRVEELTGFPELLDGRVKTLHPRVHAGLLADLAQPGHRAELEAAGIAPFDLVVVNLYPFEDTVAAPDVDPALAVERIDIGGPAMVRAAAKNHAWVAVVCDPADYPLVETALTTGGTTPSDRRTLAAKAFARTAAYDTAVATWLGHAAPAAPRNPRLRRVPRWGSVAQQQLVASTLVHSPRRPLERPGSRSGSPWRGGLRQALRYGENPHQGAAFYAVDEPGGPWGLGAASQVAGKELSYNNLLDADAALALAAEHGGRPFATIVKHTNPCGAAFGATLEEAYAGALEGDPVSAFGGVVGLSRPLDAATAKRIAAVFTEVVVAPGFDEEALAVLAGKPSLRLVRVGPARPAAPAGRPLGRRGPAGPGARPRRRRPGRLGPPGRRPARARAPGRPGPGLVGGRAREVERDRAGQRRPDRRGRGRPAEPGRLGPDRRGQGGGAGPGGGRRQRRLLPLPRRRRGPGRRRRPGRRPARRQRPRPRGHRRRGRGRHGHAPHRPPPLPPLGGPPPGQPSERRSPANASARSGSW